MIGIVFCIARLTLNRRADLFFDAPQAFQLCLHMISAVPQHVYAEPTYTSSSVAFIARVRFYIRGAVPLLAAKFAYWSGAVVFDVLPPVPRPLI